MNKRLLTFAMLLAMATGLTAAEQIVYESARVESRWLNIPASARMAGLGGVYAARGAEPAAMEVNPASLAGTRGFHVMFTHNAWVEGLARERLLAAIHLGCVGTFGLAIDYLDLGEVERVEIVNGIPVQRGTLNPSSMAFHGGWAADYGQLAVGLGIRGLTENVIDDGRNSGFQVDIGGRWNFENGMRMGVAGRNVGLDGEERPTSIRAGTGYTFDSQRPVSFDMDLDYQPYDDEPPTFRFAGEWAARNPLILRAAYIFGNDRTPSGPTAGAGWLAGPVEIDYAFYLAGDLSPAHLVTLRWLVPGWGGRQ